MRRREGRGRKEGEKLHGGREGRLNKRKTGEER